MGYRIEIEVEEGSAMDRKIQRVAAEQQLTPAEAVRHLVGGDAPEPTPMELVQQIRERRRRRELGLEPERPIRDGESIIGIFADRPDIVDAIMEASRESRRQRYGE